MGTIKLSDVTPEVIAQGRTRYLAHLSNLMMVVIDFHDGPTAQPDPPHSHPHEQITYVADGEVLYFRGSDEYRLRKGDMITIPPGTPHCIQTLTNHVTMVDSFYPLRLDFLNKNQ